jgi:hypothetical protein
MTAAAARALYRELLRQTRLLPADARAYYARYVRQTFANFSDEADAERLAQLTSRARADAAWVVRKYTTTRGGGSAQVK